MIFTEITETVAAANNQYKINQLKRQWPDAKFLLVEVSTYTRVQDQISTPNNLSAFLYNQLKLCVCTISQESRKQSECFYTELFG